ncbi:hypothetical protein [Mesorhizobium sp. B1-1-8]|uniref:hypothetical protein n=1 Tax=Mesorhizobium sp. B1-1-8 TaxID=2589976 RepID=UPI0015E35F02|nr:hypothetical protein [Mesorhizobium sp. B1-1-8]UCI10682.1 hypothetical protein FJ974_28340 [Mesorhizobium sp. B1-1-8]
MARRTPEGLRSKELEAAAIARAMRSALLALKEEAVPARMLELAKRLDRAIERRKASN